MMTQYSWSRDLKAICGQLNRRPVLNFFPCVCYSRNSAFFRYERERGRTGRGVLVDFPILMLTIAVAFVAHLIEIALWAVLFVICAEFKDFAGAYYFSAVNYSTLGYGDVIMPPSWRLLGPLEAADGALMFGVSTAMILAVIQRLTLARFADLRTQ